MYACRAQHQNGGSRAAATVSDVNPGSLVDRVPRGPGAIETKNINNGYNDTYAAYYLAAEDNQVAFTFTPPAGRPVKTPIFVVQNYTAANLPRIVVGDDVATVNAGADSGAFVSLNPTANELWITLNALLWEATVVRITADSN